MAILPQISICLPFYNAEAYIGEAIESVLNQTFRSFEFILLNDGSTDNSLAIVERFNDERIRCIECKHDFINSLNTGIESSRGKYIARMDADDIMMPDRLQLQFDFMEAHPDIAVCGGGMRFFGNGTGETTPQTFPFEISNSLIISCPLAHPTVLMRRSVLMEHNIRYDADYLYAEDYKLWTEIVKYGKLSNIPQIVLKYRLSTSQISYVHNSRQAGLSRLIRREITDYYLSLLSTETEIGRKVKEQFVPIVDELNEQAYFSSDEYFQFMHALIRGLRSRNLIKLNYDE